MHPDMREAVRNENIIIELTNRCNSNCSFCFARAGISDFRDLPENTVNDIIREAREAGYTGLHLTGGEPFLWEPLYRTLELASGLGYRSVLINSNGSLLDRTACKRIRDTNAAVRLSISLHGPAEYHEKFRGTGSWGRTLRGLECSLEENIPVHIFTTVGKSLVPVIPGFVKDTYNQFPGIRTVTLIQIIRILQSIPGIEEELLAPADFISMVKSVSLLSLYGLRVNILENPLARTASILMGMPWLPPSPPLQRAGRITFMADGTMTLSHSSRTPIGSYGKGAIKKVLNSDSYRQGVSPDRLTCPQCRHFKHCTAGGMIRPSDTQRGPGNGSRFCSDVLDLAAGQQ